MYTPGCTFLGTTLNSIYDGSDCAISRYNKPVHHSSKRGGNVLIRSTSTVRGGRLCLSWHHMVSHDVSTHELLDDRSHHHDKRSLRLQASTPPVAPTAAAPSTICTDHGSQMCGERSRTKQTQAEGTPCMGAFYGIVPSLSRPNLERSNKQEGSQQCRRLSRQRPPQQHHQGGPP